MVVSILFNRLSVALMCTLFFWVLPTTALALTEVQRLDAVLEVNTDSTLTVTETYELRRLSFTEDTFTRLIPLAHPLPNPAWTKERYVEAQFGSARTNGEEVTVEIAETDQGLQITAPLPQTGTTTTLVLSYELSGRLAYYENGDVDLLWNVTEGLSEYGFRLVTANVEANTDLFAGGRTCVTGIEGELISCSTQVSTTTITHLGRIIAPGVEFSISQSIKPQRVEKVEFLRPHPWILPGAVIFLIIVLAWILLTNRWARKQREFEELQDQLESGEPGTDGEDVETEPEHKA